MLSLAKTHMRVHTAIKPWKKEKDQYCSPQCYHCFEGGKCSACKECKKGDLSKKCKKCKAKKCISGKNERCEVCWEIENLEKIFDL